MWIIPGLSFVQLVDYYYKFDCKTPSTYCCCISMCVLQMLGMTAVC